MGCKRDATDPAVKVCATAPAKKTKVVEPQVVAQDISAQRLQNMFGPARDEEQVLDLAEDDVFDDETYLPQWARNEELTSALQDQGEPEDVFGECSLV